MGIVRALCRYGLVVALLFAHVDRTSAREGAGQGAPEPGAPLTEEEVWQTLQVHDTSTALQDAAIDGLREEQPALKEPGRFPQLMQELLEAGMRAEKEACRRHGMDHATYRQRMKRLIHVQERLFREKLSASLREELESLGPLDGAQLRREADRSMAETEEWIEKIQGKRGGVGPESGEEDGRSRPAPAPGGYAESLEEIVVAPMRERHRTGKLGEDIRNTRQRRREELSAGVAEMERQMNSPDMVQAGRDRDVVLRVAGEEKLAILKTGLAEDIPPDLLAR